MMHGVTCTAQHVWQSLYDPPKSPVTVSKLFIELATILFKTVHTNFLFAANLTYRVQGQGGEGGDNIIDLFVKPDVTQIYA